MDYCFYHRVHGFHGEEMTSLEVQGGATQFRLSWALVFSGGILWASHSAISRTTW